MALVRIPDGRIGYDSAGIGQVVVLAHADLMDRRMWQAQIDALSDQYRVIAWDRFGFGESEPGRAGPAGADLWAFLDALHVHRAVLVGCSMGAGHCLDAALLRPDRVQGLVMVSPGVPGYIWPAQMREEALPLLVAAVSADRLVSYAQGNTAAPEADVQAMARAQVGYFAAGTRPGINLDAAPWRKMVELAADMFRREWSEPQPISRPPPEPPLLQRLHQIHNPTLVIDGAADVRFVRHLAGELASGIVEAQLITLADTGHLPPMERPAQFNRILREFLGQRTSDPSTT